MATLEPVLAVILYGRGVASWSTAPPKRRLTISPALWLGSVTQEIPRIQSGFLNKGLELRLVPREVKALLVMRRVRLCRRLFGTLL